MPPINMRTEASQHMLLETEQGLRGEFPPTVGMAILRGNHLR